MRRSWKRQPGRQLAHLLQRLVVGRLARLDDQVAHAELLDERHHLLLRAGADRQHGDDGRHAEDHAEHRQQRAQLVRAQVVEPLLRARAACRGRDARRADGERGDRRVAHFTGPDAAPLFGALAAVDDGHGIDQRDDRAFWQALEADAALGAIERP